jgi:hypothetical protein
MVKAWEDAILIPTYERGPEDPNPPLLMGRRNPIHPGSSIIYPYPTARLTASGESSTWKTST